MQISHISNYKIQILLNNTIKLRISWFNPFLYLQFQHINIFLIECLIEHQIIKIVNLICNITTIV